MEQQTLQHNYLNVKIGSSSAGYLLLALSFLAMWFYPLHGKEWDEKKESLAKSHAEKEFAYEQEMLAKIENEKLEDNKEKSSE